MFLLYAILTVALTWPLAANVTVLDPGDHAFFSWEIAWEVHALRTDPARLPHANIFHPLRWTLGLDEPIFGTTLLVLPVGLFTTDPAILGNLARLLTFLVSAFTAYLLARELGCGVPSATVAGALFSFSPIRTDQIAHLSTLGTQWLPIVLLFLVRFARRGRPKDALLAAVAFVLAAYACGYHGVIGLAVLPPAAVVLLWGRWRLLPAALGAAVVAALLLLPLRALHANALHPIGYERGTEETQLYSGHLETFLATSGWNRVWGPMTGRFRTVETNNLGPGLVVPLLVLAGVTLVARARQRPSREAWALAAMAATAALVALGPDVHWFDTRLGPGPFAALRELSVFRMVRVTTRSGAYLALGLTLLAGLVLRRWDRRPLLVAGIAVVALAETLIVPIPMPDWTKVYRTTDPTPPVYAWLAAQPPGTPVVELPIDRSWATLDHPRSHESTYMLWSTRHWQPLANGYAGTEPPTYLVLRERLRDFPGPAAIEALRERGVRYAVVHRGEYGPNRWARFERNATTAPAGVRLVERFGDDLVYEIGP